MTDDIQPKTASMQGSGFYNRNSGLQAANLTSALPLLVQAAETVSVDGTRPLVIVDYGASQGRNSMAPMRAALEALRARTGGDRPIEVVHTDLPSNDFVSLFTILDEDPASYLAGQTNVFPSAIGRSYFEPILPPGCVDLGWSSNALHWMSRSPTDVPDHGWAIFSSAEQARSAARQVLAEDWDCFLRARGAEMRPGAQLVCQFLAHGPDTHGFEWMAGAFWQSIADMGQDGLLTPDELLRMTCASAGRTLAEIRAPFEGGLHAGLSLDHVALVEAPDPYWELYREHGDATRLGGAWANMMRAANGPNFAAGLAPGRDRATFLDELTRRLAARIAAAPQRSRSWNVMLLLRKAAPDGQPA